MNDTIVTILLMSTPLLFAAFGALVSEYAGVLAVFMDGAITIAGFLCIAFTVLTGNVFIGISLSILITVLFLFAIALFTEYTKANPFLTALSVNLFSSAACSFFSSSIFSTRGVITLSDIHQNTTFPFFYITLIGYVFVLGISRLLYSTQIGLQLRISGSSPEFLRSRGINPSKYKIASWCIAAFFASLAGCLISLRLGAFVPSLSAGKGWTALAAVYLGYKHPLLIICAVLLFTLSEYAANYLQGTELIPASAILGLPYALSLIVFLIIPKQKH